MSKRVVITGFGALTSAGQTVDETWNAIKNGQSGIDKITLWDVSDWEYCLGGEIKNYNPRQMVSDRKLLKLLSRHDVFGLYAANQAVTHSNILSYRDALNDPTQFNDRTGVYVASPGTKFNQQHDLLPLLAQAKRDMKRYGEELFNIVHPMWLLRILANNVLAYVGIEHGFKGPNQNIMNHAAGGVQAICAATQAIKNDYADRAIVVGYEAAIEPQAQIYYANIGALSPTGLKPFDQNRNGTILAEGAGAMMLESLESAKEREATIYGEILGDGISSEAKGIFQIRDDGDGPERSIQRALRRAELTPDKIGMITTHGNGTVNSDASEVLAYSKIFGENKIPATGFKWSLGHTIGAIGVIETIFTLLSLRENCVPGIASLDKQADDCQSIKISREHQKTQSPIGLLMTRGFCGLNASLIINVNNR